MTSLVVVFFTVIGSVFACIPTTPPTTKPPPSPTSPPMPTTTTTATSTSSTTTTTGPPTTTTTSTTITSPTTTSTTTTTTTSTTTSTTTTTTTPPCCPMLSTTVLPRQPPTNLNTYEQCSILRRMSSTCPLDGFVFCDAAPDTNPSGMQIQFFNAGGVVRTVTNNADSLAVKVICVNGVWNVATGSGSATVPITSVSCAQTGSVGFDAGYVVGSSVSKK